MNVEDVIQIMRSGEGRLWPIIEFYANSGLESDLVPYFGDEDVESTILYVLSELPRVDPRVVEAVRSRLASGVLSQRSREWAKEILFNHG